MRAQHAQHAQHLLAPDGRAGNADDLIGESTACLEISRQPLSRSFQDID
ncbi:MAG: hypothetical protein ABIQ59_18335 [Nocardioidaceae bacterium]